MLRHKGIEHVRITMPPGTQAVRMRLARCRGGTVPGLKMGGRRVVIATTVRVMLNFDDYAPLIAGRPGEALARRVWPEYRYRVPPLRRRVTTMPSAGGASGPG